MKTRNRLFISISFAGAVLLVFGMKAWNLGWLQPKSPLELNGQPAVLVFVRYDGVCECELFVNGNARSQIANWPPEERNGMQLFQIDIERRIDLANHYNVVRAPSMLLLDANGEIVWRQDGVINNDLPLDLASCEIYIQALLDTP